MRAVFLHAFGADRLTWVGTTPALAGVSAETPDLPGHGSALEDLGDDSLADLEARLEARLESGPPAWLVGHSLGGGLALRMAARSPERWKGLILMAPLGLGEGLDHDRLVAYADIDSAAEMQDFLEGLVTDKSLIVPEFATYALEQLDRPGAREAIRRIATAFRSAEDQIARTLPRVAETGLDVTVIWGARDEVVRPDRDRIRGLGRLIELPDTGHIAHVEALKDVNALLRERLAP